MPTVPTTTHPTAASFAGEGSPPASRGGAAHGSGLGRHRWPVEQTIALVHRFKRLLVCFDRTPEPHRSSAVRGHMRGVGEEKPLLTTI